MTSVQIQRVQPVACGGSRGVVPPEDQAVEVEIKL
jgi:hypothetical protein